MRAGQRRIRRTDLITTIRPTLTPFVYIIIISMFKPPNYCHRKILFFWINFNNPLYILFSGKYRYCDWCKRYHF